MHYTAVTTLQCQKFSKISTLNLRV